MEYKFLCENLLKNTDNNLSSIFDQISNNKEKNDQNFQYNPYQSKEAIHAFSLKGQHKKAKGAKSNNSIFIKRTTPFTQKMKYSIPVAALQRNLNKIGITTEVMQSIYANRSSRFIAMGFVEADGSAFTEKGQKIAAQYLMQTKGYSKEKAMEQARTARSIKKDENDSSTNFYR